MKYKLLYLIVLFPLVTFGQSRDQLYENYRTYLNKGNYNKAEKELNKLALVENDNFILLLSYGHLYSKKGELDSAKMYLERAVTFYKNSPVSFADKGLKSKKDSLYNIAIDIYDIIISKEPNGVNYCNRAIFKKDVGLYEEALVDFYTAIQIDPNEYLNHYNLALNFGKLNLPDSALAHYDKAIQLNPTHGSSYINKGYIYMELDLIHLAIPQFNLALQFEKSTKGISFTKNNIGYCYYLLKNYQEARYWIETSLKLNPINSYAHKNLALVEIELTDYAAACKSIGKAIELGYQDEYGDEILLLKKEYCTK